MNSKGKEVAEAIQREVEEWPGAAVEIVEAKRGHPKAKLTFDGKIMNVVFSATPSSSRSIHHTLADVRRALRKLGAERSKPEPSKEEDEAAYRPPNDGAAKRQPPKGERAKPQPDVADQLVSAGVVSEEEAAETRKAVQAGASAKTYEQRAAAEALRDAAEDVRAAFEARVAGIVDGIYFGLPDDVYHAVPRLSSSGIQKIDVSPATFWRGSWLDPDRPDQDEDATIWQILGRAYHVARLEPHLFEQTYVRELVKEEMPKGTLFTGPEMGKALEDMGLKKGGSVGEQAERLADNGFPSSQLWHIARAEWEEERGTRIPLPAKHYDQMIIDRDRITLNSQIAPLLQGGEAEVSVFWTDEHGVKLKSRIDYLTREWWADFKTFDNSRGKHLQQALSDAMRYNRYYMQAVVYREAVEAIRTGGLDIVEAQTDDQRALVAALRIKPGELACWYIFQEKGGIPNLLAREFPFYMVPYTTLFQAEAFAKDEARKQAVLDAQTHRTQLFMRGAGAVLNAKKLFVLYSEVYRPGEPWFPIDAIGKFSDEDFHPYWLEGGVQ